MFFFLLFFRSFFGCFYKLGGSDERRNDEKIYELEKFEFIFYFGWVDRGMKCKLIIIDLDVEMEIGMDSINEYELVLFG